MKKSGHYDYSGLNYVLNSFILQVTRGISYVFQQPVRKLLALVGVTGKAFCFLIP
jgi:hypothetical protein